jgi:hypothetical protein
MHFAIVSNINTDGLCMVVAMPGRLVVLSFIALLFLPLPFAVFGTRRSNAADALASLMKCSLALFLNSFSQFGP